ncbi:MAG: exodeoxyribonuclease VII large subunit, partial [Actinomycetales bacterium]
PTDAAKRVVPDAAEENDRLAGARARLRRAVSGFVAHEAHALAQLRSRPVLAAPLTLVDAQEDAVAHLRERTHRALGHRLDREHDAVGHHLARVRALSPLATLERGYAVAQTADGHVLTSVHDVPDAFVVRLADGSAHVTTDRTEETRHDD